MRSRASAQRRLLAERQRRDRRAIPIDSPTFLVVFGLGLGHHLEELARRTKARWLILVEPIVEFFEHSLRGRGLAGADRRISRRAAAASTSSPRSIPARWLPRIVRSMDGARHRLSPMAAGSSPIIRFWAFAEARKRLHEAIEFAFINRGFFEDELRMMTNAVDEFRRRRVPAARRQAAAALGRKRR